MKAVKIPVMDRGENVTLMEPLRLAEGSPHRPALMELVVDLTARAAGFRRSLPESLLRGLAKLVRAMNCYYSNLIEGHNTHPVDIEKAMRADYSREPRKRDLQLEARAHVTVQQWIDQGGLTTLPTSRDSICSIHRRFCELLPEELLFVEDPGTKECIHVVPGEFRSRDVKVGTHVPVSPGAVPRFIARFEELYARLGRAESILSAPAAHHRLLWIHPFLDGNGRVTRLISHATLLSTLDSGGVWSVARGLARRQQDYKAHLIACDQSRISDVDGRGNLSEQALTEFTRFFLEICIDQVEFMEGLVQPAKLRDRIMIWAEEETRGGTLPQKTGKVLEAVLFRGELPRGDVAAVVDVGDRQARRIVSALFEVGVLESESTRAPLAIAFPARLAGRWLPGLFPEAA